MFHRAPGFNENEGRGERLSVLESRLFDHLIPKRNEEAIKIDDPAFDFYDPQKRAEDKKLTEDKRRLHAERSSRNTVRETNAVRAKLFEAIVEDQITFSDWMGPEASIIVPSEYDDYVNYVDTIIEFDRPGQISHLALGVDITNSVDDVGKKIAGIKTSIEQGTLSAVEYFKSTHLTGRIDKIPRVIIGADAKTRIGVTELLLQYKILKESTDDTPTRHELFKKIRGELEHHPLQFKILYSIQAQLEAFAAYARKIGKNDLALIYENANQIIKGILRLKEAPEDKDHFEYEDEVYGLLMGYVRELARVAKT